MIFNFGNSLLCLILLYLLWHILKDNQIVENFKWIKKDSCRYKSNNTLLNVMKQHNIKKGDLTDWDLYLPCTYNNMDLEMRSIPPAKLGKKLFLINNCNFLTSKSMVWKLILDKYGIKDAKKIMPETYILKNFSNNNTTDLQRFTNGYKDGNIYIMKKNIQRQKGLKITDKYDDIMLGRKNRYIIAQDLLQDPYLINMRKINLRIYMLIVCKDNDIQGYVHKNGFMYYTKEKFQKNSTRMEPNITTGYIDRQIYIDNPLTLEDFRSYLDNINRKLNMNETKILYNDKSKRKLSNILFSDIYALLNKVLNAANKHICGTTNVPSHIHEQTSFQLFGVDISVNENLQPQMMEINKGPDMSAKDKRDKQVKTNVMIDIMTVLDMTDKNKNDHQFIKLN